MQSAWMRVNGWAAGAAVLGLCCLPAGAQQAGASPQGVRTDLAVKADPTTGAANGANLGLITGLTPGPMTGPSTGSPTDPTTGPATAASLGKPANSGASATGNGPDMGKLLATGGVSQVEGAGGGGLTPWALITGYGTRDSYGANVHLTALRTGDYGLQTEGVAVGLADRFEISLSSQQFQGHQAPLEHLALKMDTVGIKLKLTGDAVIDQDRWLPQIAVGAMFKKTHGVGGLGALGVTSVTQLGAASDHGIDYYVSATKLFLDQSVLVNATVRATKANQLGLLGFGGDRNDRYRPMFEGSFAYLINRRTVAGIEYRMKPHNLSVDPEQAYRDVFLAYFPTKNLSFTAAWVDLGKITIFNPKRQDGLYLSLQAGF